MKRIKIISVFLATIAFNVSAQDFNPDFYVFEWGLRNAQSENPEFWAELVKNTGYAGRNTWV